MELIKETWNKNDYAEYLAYLKSLADKDYKDFNSKITPNSESIILGVRVPKMRDCGKQIAKGNFRDFLDLIDNDNSALSHEEITMYGLVIGYSKLPFGEMCERIRRFASLVNNWATCDVPVSSFKGIKQFKEEYKIEIYRFLKSNNPWENRVGLITLLDYYLDTEENAKYALNQANSVFSKEYYVEMAQAWLFATAFAKHRDITKLFLENDFCLNEDVKKMTIRKLRDSFRISDEDKEWTRQW